MMTNSAVSYPLRSLAWHLENFFTATPIINTADQDLRELLAALHNHQPLLFRPEMNILFWGVFKSGKSTLINALIEEDLLPVRATHATGVITRLFHAEERTASVVWEQPSGGTREEAIPVEAIARYILLTDQEGKARPIEGIREVRIGLPYSLLPNARCTLIDSPGLSDEAEISRITLDELARADLAVTLLPAPKLFSQEERECITIANRLLNGNIAFVITQLDRIEAHEIEEVIAWTRTALKGMGNCLLGGARVFLSDLGLPPQSPHRNQIVTQINRYPSASLHAGVKDLRDWLENLTLSTKRHRLRLMELARLGAITRQVEHIQEVTQSYLAPLRTALLAEEAKTTAEREQGIQDRKLKVAQAQMVLNRIRNDLSSKDYQFQAKAQRKIQEILTEEPGENWQGEIGGTISTTCSHYSRKLSGETQAAVSGLLPQVDSFAPNLSKTARSFSVTDSSSAEQGAWIGSLAGAGIAILGPVGGLVGAGLGAWLGKKSKEQAKEETLNSVEQTLSKTLSLLHTQAERYLDGVEQLLINLERKALKPKINIQQFTLRRKVQCYSQLDKECASLLKLLKQLQEEIIR
jgi:hypothetical protein